VTDKNQGMVGRKTSLRMQDNTECVQEGLTHSPCKSVKSVSQQAVFKVSIHLTVASQDFKLLLLYKIQQLFIIPGSLTKHTCTYKSM